MNLNRRDFLKGMMALAGVAALGLPPVSSNELIVEVEQFLGSGGDPRPVGPFGSIRIGSNWYALYGASVDVYQDVADLTAFGGAWRAHAMRGWSIDCELGTTKDIQMEGIPEELEFEMRHMSFEGKGVLTGIFPLSGNYGGATNVVRFEGIGPLVYKPA